MVDAVYANLNEFRRQAKPDDDISILGVEYCGHVAHKKYKNLTRPHIVMLKC